MSDTSAAETGVENQKPAQKTLGPQRMSLSMQILIGLTAGVALGLFFGEMVAWMSYIGTGFIRLLQMTVLPYVMVALMAGLGSLTTAEAKFIMSRGGLLLLVSWVIAFSLILVTPLAFPERTSAAFFSATLLESGQSIDFLNLYIPANPFYSLANNLVPAVVLFSIAVGISLIGIRNKTGFVDNLNVLSSALSTVTKFVVKLTPIGVFAIAASASGTMSLAELTELQVYFVNYIAMCLLGTIWIFPALIAALTPFSYRDVLNISKDAMVTAFATGNVFVVLPILAENSKELFERYSIANEQVESSVDVIIPVAYNFPNAGKLMMLIFVLFAGWFTGMDVPLSQYPQLALSGLVTFFSSASLAVPYLFDTLRIPADMFQLFTLTGIVNFRFSTLLAAMSIVFLAICGASAVTGTLKVSTLRLGRYVLVSVALIALVVLGSRLYSERFATVAYAKDEIIGAMHLMQTRVDFTVYREGDVIPDLPPVTGPRLAAVAERGFLRVGYPQDMLPFVFFNARDELVGFDVQMAHVLADELEVDLEFVPATLPVMYQELADNRYDIGIGGLVSMTERLRRMTMSAPYMDATMSFVVKDYLRKDFAELATLREREDITIAVAGNPYLVRRLQNFLPNADIVTIGRGLEFFQQTDGRYDAFLATAEAGSAWTLLHPHYAVVVPGPDIIRVSLAYAVEAGEVEFVQFLNRWIEIKKRVGQIPRFYNYWVLGKDAERRGPRWSVIRDVLHWVE